MGRQDNLLLLTDPSSRDKLGGSTRGSCQHLVGYCDDGGRLAGCGVGDTCYEGKYSRITRC